MRRSSYALAVALPLLLSTGCASQVGFGRASTLEPGRQQVTGFGQLDLMAPKMQQGGDAVGLPWAHVGIGYRRGLAERVEVGGRGWIFGLPAHLSFGLAGDAKVQIVRSTPGRGLQVASGLSLGYHQAQIGGTPWHTFTAWAPLLFGHDFGKQQFVVGPRAGFTRWTGEGQNPIDLPWFGASTGVSFGVGSKTQVMPEIVFVYAPVSFNGAIRDERYGATLLQLGLSASYSP